MTKQTLKRIFSPPLLGFLAALLMILLNVRLPSFIMDSCKYIGNLTTPLSLLYIGITFRSIDLRGIRLDKDMAAMLFGRFVLSPAVIFALYRFMPIPELMLKVFIIQASMPVIASAAITVKAFDGDSQYATLMVTVTTILSIVFIPLYMWLLSVTV